ncbi:MAG: hypothetical protein KGO51_14455 [Alphaproteobacteria bacterium]|nr:hypothetical protein [Alphaproteobacteria bacterium]
MSVGPDTLTHPALVSRATVRSGDEPTYLQLTPGGQAAWTLDAAAATAFPSMREATRAAMRLPSSIKAFSLLRDMEVTLATPH